MSAVTPIPSPARGLTGVLKRLGAGCYDGLLVGGLLMVATGLATYFTRPAAGATALQAYPHRLLYQLVALAVIVLYFGISWTTKGQTLGMKAWRLRLLTADGAIPDWRHALLRLLFALPLWLAPVAGLFLYMRRAATPLGASLAALPLAISLLSGWASGITLHDRASRTRVTPLDPGDKT